MRLRRAVYGALVLGCLLTTALVGAVPSSAAEGTRVRVLQMNLCNSGLAGCYTGRSVSRAAAVIRAQAPDLVTLNEVCRADVPILERAMGGAASSAFQPARNRPTGGAVRCRNGEPYGIALLSRRPSLRTSGGIYPTQNPADPEERAWLCVSTTGFAACTTHLDATNAAVARAQCRYLVATVLPPLRSPTVVGGDFNLRASMKGCLAAGQERVDDGGVQNVVVGPQFAVSSQRRIDMLKTTDHPGLLVTAQLRTAATANVV
ncbi:MAG: endonuclease/exonuclease/phosphatase family protein [Pseudonocardia sp.]|nr:endonuclease/exonuclease/phosphatase family protein [Pseudonocardia sp.]